MIINPKKLIINRYDKQTAGHRTITVVMLILFWGALFYLMRPLFIIVGWFFAYLVFDNVLGSINLQDALTVVFTRYVPAVLIISFCLWAWATYNRRRFSGKKDKRRVPNPPATVEQIAESTPYLTLHQIEDMRAAKALVCYYDEQGEVRSVDCCLTLDGINDALARAVAKQQGVPTLAEAEYPDFDHPAVKELPAEIKKRRWPRLFSRSYPGETALSSNAAAQEAPPQVLREPDMPLSEAITKALAGLSKSTEPGGRIPDNSSKLLTPLTTTEVEPFFVQDVPPESGRESPPLSPAQQQSADPVRLDKGQAKHRSTRRPALGRRSMKRRRTALSRPRKHP